MDDEATRLMKIADQKLKEWEASWKKNGDGQKGEVELSKSKYQEAAEKLRQYSQEHPE